MKYAFAAAAIVATVSAQDLSLIPTCAQPCIASAVASGTNCAATDYACICNNVSALESSGAACVLAACPDLTAVLSGVQSFCAEVATAVVATSTTAAAAASSTSVAESATSVTTIPTSYPTSTAATSAAATYPASTTTVPGSASGTGSVSNSTATKSSPTSVVTAGASLNTVGSIGMLVLGAIAAAVY